MLLDKFTIKQETNYFLASELSGNSFTSQTLLIVFV